MWKKRINGLVKDKILILTHAFLFLFLLAILAFSTTYKHEIFDAKLFGQKINLTIIMLLMCIFEFLSTLTFQLRMKLTARFEATQDKSLIWKVPLIAGISWIIAGTQGIFLIGDTENLYRTLLKFVPVFIATFNGVYIVMKSKI